MSLRERTRPGLGIIEPCLPSPAKAPPSGPGWLHEIKHDGFRIMARRDGAGVRLITRNGNDFTARFPLAVEAVARLPAHYASEIAAIAEPFFAGLNARLQLQPVMNADDLKRGLDIARQAM
jgi:ATP-dependent DNA ligase